MRTSKHRRWILAIQIVAICSLVTSAAIAGPVLSSGPLTQVSGSSPWAASSCGLEGGQSGINYLDSEVEPWFDVNPTDPDGLGLQQPGDNIVGTWQQDRWSNGGSRGLIAGVSFDGGASWQSVVVPGLSHCSGGSYQRASDPWLSFAPNGDLYHASLSFNNVGGGSAIIVSESPDGGLNWNNPPTVIADETDTGAFNDKESIYADSNDANYVYVTWQVTGDTWFARTTNAAAVGEATWENPRMIWNPPQNTRTIAHQIVALPNDATFGGSIINGFAWFDKGSKKKVALIRSSDHGATWSQNATVVGDLRSIATVDPETNHGIRVGTNIPDFAVNPSSGALYAVWQDSRFGPRKNSPNSIAFSQSTDGGLTWSTPIRVNQTPTGISAKNQQAFTASVSVTSDGTIGVTYYDFRSNTSDATTLLTNYWAAHCHPATPAACASAANWGDEVEVTDGPFDMSDAPDASGWFVGDYEGLASEGGSILPLFSQEHGSDPASIFFRRIGP